MKKITPLLAALSLAPACETGAERCPPPTPNEVYTQIDGAIVHEIEYVSRDIDSELHGEKYEIYLRTPSGREKHVIVGFKSKEDLLRTMDEIHAHDTSVSLTTYSSPDGSDLCVQTDGISITDKEPFKSAPIDTPQSDYQWKYPQYDPSKPDFYIPGNPGSGLWQDH